MLTQVARFELRYQIRSPIFWITSFIFLALTFTLVTSDDLRIGWGGYVARNSPFAIATMCMIMVIFAIFIVTTFVSNVILRDDESGFGPIVHATRLTRFDYLFGRFTGGFLTTCLVFLSVPLGVLIASAMPWLDPGTVGPFQPGAYLYAYLVLCVPTLFVLSASFFSLATVTRSMIATYIVALVVLMAYLLTTTYFARKEFADIAAVLDPFGMSGFRSVTQHWTASERNSLLTPIVGHFLQNRILWVTIAFALLAVTWRTYKSQLSSATKASKRPAEEKAENNAPAAGPLPRPSTDTQSLGWGPLVALTKFDVLSVLRSPAYIVLLGIGFMNTVVGLWYAGEDNVSITLPVTRIMIKTLIDQFTLIPLIIAAYYAGELVWRDRERRVNEIVDATPSADWAFVLPKIIAIAIVLFSMALISVGAALCVQAVKGYFDFEFSHYLVWYVLPWLLNMVMYAVLAVFVQMLVPHKFGGLLITLLVLVAQMSLSKLGFEHNLYHFASSSPVPLSDMNGQGEFAKHAAWFRLYWAAFSAILAVLAYGLWRRGASSPLKGRMQRLPSRLQGPAGFMAAGAAAVMVAAGGYIYYNTNVLNEYRTFIDSTHWSAEYEKTVLPFEKVTQPRIVDVKLNVDIYPTEPRVVTRGTYVVENRTNGPLSEVHVTWPRQLEMKSFLGPMVVAEVQMQSLEVPGAKMTREFPDLHYRIFTFDQPLAPGQRAEVRFETVREQRGFKNTNNEMRVVENGVFIDNWQIAPVLGPNRWVLLADRTQRRKFGLPDEIRPPALEDESGRAHHYFRHDSDWINADVTVTSTADHVIVAPGQQLDTKVEGDRRVSHFRTEAPIQNFFSIQSARYAVKEDKWNDVKLAVYYHPTHPYNVDRMITAMKASMDYYSTNFSPYQFNQFRIVEFPAYSNFAQAFPGTIPYSEAAGFILDSTHRDRIDFITYVTAHEAGHQWWAHQVIGADMQGQTVLSETLAQYAALMVMERMYGVEEIRKFLKGSLDGYLRGRASDLIGEVPLERVENQAHIRYQKGGMVMYLLKDLMGEDAVNRALQALIRDYAFKPAPYPTSRDLITRLRAEAKPELQDLITDLFENITLYDLKVTGSRATRQADGKWSVAIDLNARKLYADAKGEEREAPLEGEFDIGVFTAEPGKPGFKDGNVLFMQRQHVSGGKHTVTVVVDQEPKFVGFDPYNKYVDRNSDDNLVPIGAES
ncbi:ABC transporter permease/M1 family aminopeptidase [Steroidobacter flavus]|uniref:ABC transporter permease/M1 family aminopeptidase n=1 Tax=Steroidobacter flavus TaxID=1842136 RepID=A0ABV8T285_9GAMM